MTAADLFGDRAADYARHRPTYPEALFDHLASLAPARDVAWDCGAGSGQSARTLARRFASVVATDASLRQLEHAERAERVHWAAALAERAPLRARSLDLITVSAAIHWFDHARFYAEVRRVARAGAVLAVWSYLHTRIAPEIDPVLARYADEIVAPWWPPAFAINRDQYRSLDFPFDRLPWLECEASASMRLEDLLAYVRTWSASQAWAREKGGDPVATIRADLARLWGDPAQAREVRWPLHGVIGVVR